MKSFLIPLAVLCAFWTGASASAGVFVHAGPVSVAVGRPAGWRAGYARPVYRPAVRPALPAVALAIIPQPVPVFAPRPSITPADVYRHRQAMRAWLHDKAKDAVEDALHDTNR